MGPAGRGCQPSSKSILSLRRAGPPRGAAGSAGVRALESVGRAYYNRRKPIRARREQARLAAQLAALAGERWDLSAGRGGGACAGALRTAAARADALAALFDQRVKVRLRRTPLLV